MKLNKAKQETVSQAPTVVWIDGRDWILVSDGLPNGYLLRVLDGSTHYWVPRESDDAASVASQIRRGYRR